LPEVAAPTIALLLICHQRQQELLTALASAENQGFDEIVVADMGSTVPLTVPAGVRLLRSENLGVAGGRNLLAAESTADVCAFVDDDAVLAPDVCARLREHFADPAAADLVAFRIDRPGGMERWEQPFRLGREVPDAPTPCSYFVGAGHAVRRARYLAAGGYDDRLFYSAQELDLSFKLMRDGSTLMYDPRVAVEHRPSTAGRSPSAELPGMLLHDRLLVARAHLPLAAAAVHALAWLGKTGRAAVTGGGLGHWWRALGAGVRRPVRRRPLPWALLRQVHRLGGRVFF
jgi:GT2 family glycosyltransferase